MAAAVILDLTRPIEGLNDSKKLSEKARERLAIEIREKALAWAIAEASQPRSTASTSCRPLSSPCVAPSRRSQRVRIALASMATRCHPTFACPAEAVVKGDGKIAAIAAASILAKTHRDAPDACSLADEYPQCSSISTWAIRPRHILRRWRHTVRARCTGAVLLL